MYEMKRAEKILSERENEIVEQVMDYIPYFFNASEVLYIGASPDEFLFAYHFENCRRIFKEKILHYMAKHPRVDLLEVDEERAFAVRKKHGSWLRNVVLGDVTDLNHVPGLRKKYDLIVWAFGPSVIPIEQVWPTVYNLELTGEVVAILVPFGKYSYPDNVEVNPLDRHITEFRPIDFLKRGYAVHCIGEKDTRRSCLLAWKNIAREGGRII